MAGWCPAKARQPVLRAFPPNIAQRARNSLFVVWESGLTETILQRLPAIFSEKIFQRIHWRVSQFVKAKLDKMIGSPGARAASALRLSLPADIQVEIDKGPGMFGAIPIENIPLNAAPDPDQALSDDEKAQIERTINADSDLRRQVAAIAASRGPQGDTRARSAGVATATATLMDPEVIAEIAPIGPAMPSEARSRVGLGTIALGKKLVTVVGAVIWRFGKRRDHGPYLTIVEEIMREFYVRALGRGLWVAMKDAIDNAFAFEPDSGGTALVGGLCDLWRSGVTPFVTLIGHSAGAIYVSRLLTELHTAMPPEFRVNVVLIAPACTFDTFARSLRQAESRVANLRVFGMGDELERKDSIVPGLYPASLLYFVSGVLEDSRDEPLVGMERYYSSRYEGEGFGAIGAVNRCKSLARQHPFAWAKLSGFDGANCDMTSHGGWAGTQVDAESVKLLVARAAALSGNGGPVGKIAAVIEGRPRTIEMPDPHGLGDRTLVLIRNGVTRIECYVKPDTRDPGRFTAWSDAELKQPADTTGIGTGATVERLNPEDWAIVAGINYYPGLTDLQGPRNPIARCSSIG